MPYARAAAPDDRPPHVLVVEDDPVGREILVSALEGAGFAVTTAGCGAEALRILRERSGAVDWLFVDIVLPGPVDGWLVGAEFHLSHPFKPIIYASAYKQEPERRSAGSVFLPKPVKPARVVELFRDLGRRAA